MCWPCLGLCGSCCASVCVSHVLVCVLLVSTVFVLAMSWSVVLVVPVFVLSCLGLCGSCCTSVCVGHVLVCVVLVTCQCLCWPCLGVCGSYCASVCVGHVLVCVVLVAPVFVLAMSWSVWLLLRQCLC